MVGVVAFVVAVAVVVLEVAVVAVAVVGVVVVGAVSPVLGTAASSGVSVLGGWVRATDESTASIHCI